MANVNISESAIQENSMTEVHNNEQAQTEVSAAEQPESSAVPSVPEEQQAAGAEAAVSEVSEETGISGTTESVISESSGVPDTAMTTKNVQAFLLLAAVFGAVIAAMVLKRKFQRDKRKKTVDKSQLTAKERDEIRLAEKKRKRKRKRSLRKSAPCRALRRKRSLISAYATTS